MNDFEKPVLDKAQMGEVVYRLLNKAPFGFVVLIGPDFSFEVANELALGIIQRKREEIIGKPFFEVLPEAREQGLEQLFDSIYHSGKRVVFEEQPVRFSSSGVNETRYFNINVEPLRQEEEKIIGLLATASEVTTQKALSEKLSKDIVKRTEELNKSREHFSLLFHLSPVAKTLSRLSDGVLVDANPAWEKMFDRKRAEAIGKSVVELGMTTAAYRVDMVKLIEENGGSLHGIELEFDNGHGGTTYSYASIVTIELDGVKHLLTAHFDITGRKKAEEEIKESAKILAEKNITLEKLNKELESFNFIASHDLQEPLRKISTFASLIQNSKDKVDVDLYLKKIDNASQRMSSLIQSLLTLSRLPRDARKFGVIDLNQILDDVKTDLEHLINEKKALIECPRLPLFRGDPLQMQQLFSNIISNSLKFSKEDPIIRISSAVVSESETPIEKQANPNKQYLQLTFQDNGIGFEPQFKERIFNLFQRLHPKHEYEGTGIGLSIVKRIIEHHNGFIAADSQLNEGARFTIWLPC
ncbi:MAG TPA: ATP-binding protein [Cyclobacteriaceae bacterium]|nr:ATP-binding protein [Cyclobacteriaceae bacterium]